MSALASGADWLFIPEAPPEDGWENFMCERLGEVSGQQGFLLQPLENLRGRCPWDPVHSLAGSVAPASTFWGIWEGHGVEYWMLMPV